MWVKINEYPLINVKNGEASGEPFNPITVFKASLPAIYLTANTAARINASTFKIFFSTPLKLHANFFLTTTYALNSNTLNAKSTKYEYKTIKILT